MNFYEKTVSLTTEVAKAIEAKHSNDVATFIERVKNIITETAKKGIAGVDITSKMFVGWDGGSMSKASETLWERSILDSASEHFSHIGFETRIGTHGTGTKDLYLSVKWKIINE